MTKTKTLLLAGVLGVALTAPETQAKTIQVGIDLSASAPITWSDAFAKRAGVYVAGEIEGLAPGDRVQLRTLGEYGPQANARRIDLTISKRYRPREVASAIEEIVQSIPQLVADGELESQQSTNLIGYLQAEARLIDCEADPVEIVLITDGLEASSYVDGMSLIEGKATLPAAPQGVLEGCSLTLLGIGQIKNGTPAFTQRLIGEWEVWSAAAGVDRFIALETF